LPLDAFTATQEAFAELSATPEASPPSEESTQDTSSSESSQSATNDQATDSTASPATEGSQSAASSTPAGSTEQKPEGPVPLSRHKEILENTRREYEAKLQRLSWAEQVQGDPNAIAERLEAMRVAETDPQAFLGFLRNHPLYAPLLQPQPQSAPVHPPATQDDPMPKPDKLFEDGSTGYSGERLQQLMEWRDRQNDKRYSERFGPIEQQFRATQIWNEALERTAPKLEQARSTWEGFRENEGAIRAIIEDAVRRGDTSVTLESAYRQAVVPKLKADEAALRARIRQELIEESNRKSAAVTEVPGGPVAKPAPKDLRGRPMVDVVSEVYKELAGG
jgi:hypothetical protein